MKQLIKQQKHILIEMVLIFRLANLDLKVLALGLVGI